jgi:threonine dehydratase
MRSSFLSELCQGEVYLKLENLQVTNSFKIRGALTRMKLLNAEELRRGVITASAGNHAQAVAICAAKLDSPAIVVVPVTTPKIKIEKIRQQNVELILHGEVYDAAEQFARQLAKERNLTFISAYNDANVVAGQGTIGLEILEDLPNVESIIVPIGGGGVIAGIATAAKNVKPSTEILGAQPQTAASMYHSLKAGKIVDVEMGDTIADGLSGNIEKGCITFEIIQRYVDEVLLFDEKTIRKTIRILWEKERQIVEGAGAISIAPIVTTPNRFAGKRTVSVITGGNIDDSVFKEILSQSKID